jgi:ferritin-like metal-binding protein YciE
MSLQNLADIFHHELRDILGAEKQLLKAMPKMIKAATDPDLRRALEKHFGETEVQLERVEEAFKETGKTARSKTCEAMKGILEECDSVLEADAPSEVKDALIIAAAQKVEHYEISTYGTLCTWANLLGYESAFQLLKQTISEEEETDQALSELAVRINDLACSCA